MLLGELKAFREQTKEDLTFIKGELKKNAEFRWWLAGALAAVTTVFQVGIAYFKLKSGE